MSFKPPQKNIRAGLFGRILRLYRAWGYSLSGLRLAYREETAFREEVWLGLPLCILVWVLPLPLVWSVLMVAAIVLLLVTELLNSAIEAVVDLASPSQHPLAKKAKDCASAAVLVALVLVFICWGIGLSQWGK